jgi:hypothetical protein
LDQVRELVNDEGEASPMVEDGVCERKRVYDEMETSAEEEALVRAPSRPVVAKHGTLEVTSRDLLRILLAKLPARFHEIVGQEFGGPTLAEECAKRVSTQMIADRIPISELRRNGYPREIVELVKQLMATSC